MALCPEGNRFRFTFYGVSVILKPVTSWLQYGKGFVHDQTEK